MKRPVGRLVLQSVAFSLLGFGALEASTQDLQSDSCTERMEAAIDLLRDSIAGGGGSLERVLDGFSLPPCPPGDQPQQHAAELADMLEGMCGDNPGRGQRFSDIAGVLEDVTRAFHAGNNPTDFGGMAEILRDRRFPDCDGFSQPLSEDEAPDGRDPDFDNLDGLIERLRAFQPPQTCGQDAASYGRSLRSVEGSSGFNLREDCVAEYVVELAAIIGEQCAVGAHAAVNAGIEETLSDVRADIRYGFGAESGFERQLAQRLFDRLREPCAEVLLATGADGFVPRDLDTLDPVVDAFGNFPGSGGWSYWWFLPVAVIVVIALVATVWAISNQPPRGGGTKQHTVANGAHQRPQGWDRAQSNRTAVESERHRVQEISRHGPQPPVGSGAELGNGGFREKVVRAVLKAELEPLRSDFNKLSDEFAGVQGAVGSLPQEVTTVRDLAVGLERRLDELADAINELRNAQRDTEKKASRALEGAKSKNASAPESFRTAQVRSEQAILALAWERFQRTSSSLARGLEDESSTDMLEKIRRLLEVFPGALKAVDEALERECRVALRRPTELNRCYSSLASVPELAAGSFPEGVASSPEKLIFRLRDNQRLLERLGDPSIAAALVGFDARTWCREEFIGVADEILQLQQTSARDSRAGLDSHAIDVLLATLHDLGRLQWIELWLGKSAVRADVYEVTGTVTEPSMPHNMVYAVNRNGFVDLDTGKVWRIPEVVANVHH